MKSKPCRTSSCNIEKDKNKVQSKHSLSKTSQDHRAATISYSTSMDIDIMILKQDCREQAPQLPAPADDNRSVLW